MFLIRRRLSGTRSARVVVLSLCAVLLLAGCSDDNDEPEAAPPGSPSSSSPSTSPTEETSSTEAAPSAEPATGPRLSLENITLRMPEGWTVDENQASFQVNGTSANGSSRLYLASFPALNRDVSLAQMTRTAAETRRLPESSIQPRTTLADVPAYHLSGRAAGDDVEQFGTLVDGDLITVEFVFYRGKDTGREELIDSVLATVELR